MAGSPTASARLSNGGGTPNFSALIEFSGGQHDDRRLHQYPKSPSTTSKVLDGIQSASRHVSDAIEAGRRPGMPLDSLAQAVREAPLAALAIAFMVGVTVAGRRR